MDLLRKEVVYSRVVYLIVAIYVLLMLSSLQYRFLDSFFVGTRYGNIGFDFFSIPRGFSNLLSGESIFNSKYPSYGPYATWYPYHPFLALAIGSWLSLFDPWVSYLIFVLVSLGILFFTARLLATLFQNKILQALCYFSVICSPPVYLMIWNAQAHIFLVLSTALILISIHQYYKAEDKKADRNMMAGLLISLLSKPIVFLIIPVLFVNKKTRKTTLITLLIYAVISIVFLLLPFLNPKGDNQVHWTNIYYQSRIIESNNPELFSLPTFIDQLFGIRIFDVLYKIPLLLALGISMLIVFIKEEKRKIIFLLLSFILISYCYYLSYNLIWEYQYTTILPTVMIFILLATKVPELQTFRKLIFAISILSVSFYIPTLFFLIRDYCADHLVLLRTSRLLPVVAMFFLLYLLIIDYLIQLKKEGNLNLNKIDV